MQVKIIISEINGPQYITVPWIPDQIKFTEGESETATYKIMNKGDVAVPSGMGLAAYSWESIWPGKYRTNDWLNQDETYYDPKVYHNIMTYWLKNGTKLNLLVTGYPINKNVHLKKYECNASGGFGDMVYNVEFEEDREITITTTTVPNQTKRPAATNTTSYTIKRGDTLWGIAKKFYKAGSKWPTIYNANKDIIESTAKSRGYRSSNNGWWIFPGVTIKIPR